MFNRVTIDYAKWHLLSNEMAGFTASLYGDNWDIFRKKKYPKSSKFDEVDDFACLELVENSMPFAIARPFVKEFITDELKTKVHTQLHMYLTLHII